jgi:hypothetical protein
MKLKTVRRGDDGNVSPPYFSRRVPSPICFASADLAAA